MQTMTTRGYCYDCNLVDLNGRTECQCGSICYVTSRWEGGVEVSRKCACDCTVSLANEPNASCEK